MILLEGTNEYNTRTRSNSYNIIHIVSLLSYKVKIKADNILEFKRAVIVCIYICIEIDSNIIQHYELFIA